MNLLRFLGLLFMLVSIFAGTTVAVALLVLALRFWPLLLVILLTLVTFQYATSHPVIRR
jgi:hypothetical protein